MSSPPPQKTRPRRLRLPLWKSILCYISILIALMSVAQAQVHFINMWIFFYNFSSKISFSFQVLPIYFLLFISCSYDRLCNCIVHCVCVCVELFVCDDTCFYVTCSAVLCMRWILRSSVQGDASSSQSYTTTSNSKKENMFFVLFCSECFLFLYLLYVFVCVFGLVSSY